MENTLKLFLNKMYTLPYKPDILSLFYKAALVSFIVIVARMSDVAPGPLVSRSDSFFKAKKHLYIYIFKTVLLYMI